jgi:hypothetical protein
VAISDPATAHFTAHKKPRKHKYRIQTEAHTHPHTPWNTRSQGKKPRWQLVTQLLTDHNMQGAPKYQYKIHTNTQWHTNTIAYRSNDTTFETIRSILTHHCQNPTEITLEKWLLGSLTRWECNIKRNMSGRHIVRTGCVWREVAQDV